MNILNFITAIFILPIIFSNHTLEDSRQARNDTLHIKKVKINSSESGAPYEKKISSIIKKRLSKAANTTPEFNGTKLNKIDPLTFVKKGRYVGFKSCTVGKSSLYKISKSKPIDGFETRNMVYFFRVKVTSFYNDNTSEWAYLDVAVVFKPVDEESIQITEIYLGNQNLSTLHATQLNSKARTKYHDDLIYYGILDGPLGSVSF